MTINGSPFVYFHFLYILYFSFNKNDHKNPIIHIKNIKIKVMKLNNFLKITNLRKSVSRLMTQINKCATFKNNI